ncbi:MAG TPA: glycosyltransferase family 2 protein [Armatimonadetes bacterium]|nr:glycosyltransferase family 2 protein [Armatimonadota bacterium]
MSTRDEGAVGDNDQAGNRTRLCVIIVSWNVSDDLRVCLESVYAGNGGDFEVWVVDNASSDGTVEMLRERFPQVRLIANTANRGFAAANNQALADADADYFLLLNPDTIVPEGAFDTLLRFADAHPEAGVIGPKLLNRDGSLQYSARRFPTFAAAVYRNTPFGKLFPGARAPQDYLMVDWDHNDARAVDWVSGACMLIRREALAEVGLLDEEFYWGSEDVDYCFRMRHAGRGVLYTPEPAIIHAIGSSTSQVVIRTIIRTHRSMHRLYSKHLARNPLSRGLIWLGIWSRAGLLIVEHSGAWVWTQLKSVVRRLRRR